MLQAGEAPVFEVLHEDGKSPFFLTADHAGRSIPRVLGDLGVCEAERARHIGWDIGIASVTRHLSAALEATAILQTYSRLVIDCNRIPSLPSAFPEVSESTIIPGNQGLSEAEKQARQTAIFDPYHREIKRLIQARPRTVYVAMHSFTPVYKGQNRPMQIAVLYDRNPLLSQHLANLLRAEGDLVVAENEPYHVGDGTDYGVPVHAQTQGLDYLEIEIRQDLITDEVGQKSWANRLARLFPLALLLLEQQKTIT